MTEREPGERLREYGAGLLVAKMGAEDPRLVETSGFGNRNCGSEEELKTASGQNESRSFVVWTFGMPSIVLAIVSQNG